MPIETITLKFGRTPGSPAEEINTTPVTVFVGPNNSGKSKVLAELYEYCVSGTRNTMNVILDHVKFRDIGTEEAEDRIKRITLRPNPNEALPPDHIIVGKKGSRSAIPRPALLHAMENPNTQTARFCSWYLVHNTLILDGLNRINLINQQKGGDLQQPPKNSLQFLFQDNDKRKEVRRIVKDALGLVFSIDPTQLGTLRIKFSKREPTSELEERGIHEEAVKYHKDALPVEQTSDGVKAFAGIVTEIIAGDPDVLLIDEPEAFLHPSLSFKLGKEIALATHGTEKRLFVSTHSPSFVMGCIQSGVPVNIVRLTYRGDVATARVLPSEDLLRLMRNPLFRSTGVLNGLFYEFVVVTEADSDRAFYQEINERLLSYNPELGIPNCLFLNAQNKQTVRLIIRPLRQLGIPAAGLVDIDVLKEGGTVWRDFLSSGFVPTPEQQPLGSVRADLKRELEGTGRDMKRDGGIALLSGEYLEAAENLLNRLAEYGLFVVHTGELEAWLPSLQGIGHGPSWLIDVFEKMGEDPADAQYLRPAADDVWGFIGIIKSWMVDANRKGIPA